LRNENQNNDFSLFPNPTKGEFSISGINFSSVQVLDVNGRCIYKTNSGNSENVIDLNKMNADKGLYFVFITENSGRKIYRKLIYAE